MALAARLEVDDEGLTLSGKGIAVLTYRLIAWLSEAEDDGASCAGRECELAVPFGIRAGRRPSLEVEGYGGNRVLRLGITYQDE
jgi:hypothetical protein